MSPKSYPDYYRILQVHPEAEQEVIEGAFHRLMRKYHPDSVEPDQKDNPEIQRRAREIIEAYDILGDPAKRKQYDNDCRPKGDETPTLDSTALTQVTERPTESRVEKLVYEVKCAKTKRPFQMLLARRSQSGSRFQIIGFQPISEASRDPAKPRQGFPSEAELEAMFEETPQLTMSDIDWNTKCPDCQSSFVVAANSDWYWFRCGSCSHLFCAGAFHKNLRGEAVGKCPWCGVDMKLDLSRLGSKSVSTIRGGSKLRQLDGGSQPPKLPDGQGGNLFKLPGHPSKEKK